MSIGAHIYATAVPKFDEIFTNVRSKTVRMDLVISRSRTTLRGSISCRTPHSTNTPVGLWTTKYPPKYDFVPIHRRMEIRE